MTTRAIAGTRFFVVGATCELVVAEAGEIASARCQVRLARRDKEEIEASALTRSFTRPTGNRPNWLKR
jgi:hypothetical protein